MTTVKQALRVNLRVDSPFVGSKTIKMSETEVQETTDVAIKQVPQCSKENEPPTISKEVVESYFTQQNKLLRQMAEQQTAVLAKFGVINTEPPSKKKRKNDEAEVTLSLGETGDDIDRELHQLDAETNEKNDEEDAFSTFHKGHIGEIESDSISEEEEENILSSKYASMLEQVEEKMGNPLKSSVAKLCADTWGRAVLEADKKKELLKEVEIPKNCKNMKAPKLNTEVYVKLFESAQAKDKASQSRQVEVAKASVPLYKILEGLEDAQKALKAEWSSRKENGKTVIATKAEKQAHKAMDDIYPLVMQSLRILNYNFTESTRKRKYDVCGSLGEQFKAFAQSKSSSEFLFDDEASKRMKSELKLLKVKGGGKKKAYGNNQQQSKNYPGSKKSSGSQRGGHNQYNSQYNSNSNQAPRHFNNQNQQQNRRGSNNNRRGR